MSDAINPTLAKFDQLPDSAMVRPKVCAELLGISIASYWRLVKSGQLRTIKLTERTTACTAGSLRSFMAAKARV